MDSGSNSTTEIQKEPGGSFVVPACRADGFAGRSPSLEGRLPVAWRQFSTAASEGRAAAGGAALGARHFPLTGKAVADRLARAAQKRRRPPACTPVIFWPTRFAPEKFLVRPAEPARPKAPAELLSIWSTRP